MKKILLSQTFHDDVELCKWFNRPENIKRFEVISVVRVPMNSVVDFWRAFYYQVKFK